MLFKRIARIAALLIASGAPVALAQSTTAAVDPHSRARAPFAIVDDTMISTAEYDAAFVVAQRNRFYHAKVPEAQVIQLRREVGDELINRVLLVEEARRRNVAPDQASVKAQLDDYEKRYGSSPQWPKMKAEAVPALTAELERRSVLARIEAEVRVVPPPSDAVLREFQRQNPEAFTEPEKIKVAVILLKVDPSAPREAWIGARDEAAAIRARLQRGADFADQARLHSADESAARGGDMGYLHRGMLPEALQGMVDQLRPGDLSEPITTLEGVALLRVDDRKSAQLRDFESVRARAQQLWQRQEGEKAWRAFLQKLRSKARVQVVDASRYPSIASAAETAPTAAAATAVEQ